MHGIWISEKDLLKIAAKKLKNFKERRSNMEDQLETFCTDYAFDADYLKIERILSCKKSLIDVKNKLSFQEVYNRNFNDYKISNNESIYFKNLIHGDKHNYRYLIKWEGLNYDECTWEDEIVTRNFLVQLKKFFELKIVEERMFKKRGNIGSNKKQLINISKLSETKKQIEYNERSQPNYIEGGVLHDFQVQGFEWFCKSWKKSNSVVLADEMGLGKTIQTLSFLYFLKHECDIEGPFLIVAPASTLINWLRESNIWTPKFNSIVYMGNQEAREIIRSKEFFFFGPKNQQKQCKFNCLITNYEICLQDAKYLKRIKWEVFIIDEAHRLKNNNSRLFKEANSFKVKFKILLTGTPLQNSINELINLVEFLNPSKAKTLRNIEILKNVFDNSNKHSINEEEKKKVVHQLTEILHPHILRRTKEEVEIQLPELEEIIVKVSLTENQKFFYKNVLVKNYEILKMKSNKVSLINLLMNLRLVCNHPILFSQRKSFEIPPKEKFR